MDLEDYINRSDVMTWFEDIIYMDYFTWFVHFPNFRLWNI